MFTRSMPFTITVQSLDGIPEPQAWVDNWNMKHQYNLNFELLFVKYSKCKQCCHLYYQTISCCQGLIINESNCKLHDVWPLHPRLLLVVACLPVKSKPWAVSAESPFSCIKLITIPIFCAATDFNRNENWSCLGKIKLRSGSASNIIFLLMIRSETLI